MEKNTYIKTKLNANEMWKHVLYLELRKTFFHIKGQDGSQEYWAGGLPLLGEVVVALELHNPVFPCVSLVPRILKSPSRKSAPQAQAGGNQKTSPQGMSLAGLGHRTSGRWG